jgi:hypothetical protein
MGVAIGQEEEETALATVSSSLIHLLNNPIYVNYYRKGQLHIINKVTYYTLYTHSLILYLCTNFRFVIQQSSINKFGTINLIIHSLSYLQTQQEPLM